jgi:hypothetical protein
VQPATSQKRPQGGILFHRVHWTCAVEKTSNDDAYWWCFTWLRSTKEVWTSSSSCYILVGRRENVLRKWGGPKIGFIKHFSHLTALLFKGQRDNYANRDLFILAAAAALGRWLLADLELGLVFEPSFASFTLCAAWEKGIGLCHGKWLWPFIFHLVFHEEQFSSDITNIPPAFHHNHSESWAAAQLRRS